MKSTVIFIISVIIFTLSPSLSKAYTFRPQWVPQTQFAGFYLAEQKGFYKKAGIDIEIKEGGPGILGMREVAEKKTDFVTAWLISAIRLREKGMKIVLIGQIFQRSALMLVAKKESGIDSVEKFSYRTIGVWPGDLQIPPKALFRQNRVMGVKIVNQAFTMKPFLDGEIDVASAMQYNEYHQLLESGLKPDDLVVFNYSDLGMNLPEDGIYVREAFQKENPDACRRFIRASIEGWKYAFAHKAEAVELMTGLANKTAFKTTEKKQRVMLDEVEKLMDLDSTHLKEEDFQTAKRILKSVRIIKTDVEYDDFVKE